MGDELRAETESLLGLGGGSTRERVLRGAAVAFSRTPPEAVTVQDILDAAGISRRTFYLKFGSKEAALDELHALVTQVLVRRILVAPLPGETIADVVVYGLDGVFDLLDTLGGLAHVFAAEGSRAGSTMATRQEQTQQAVVDFLQPHLREGLDPLEIWGWTAAVGAMIQRVLPPPETGLTISAADRQRVQGAALRALQALG